MAEPGGVVDSRGEPSALLWRATPRPRRIALEFLGSLVFAAGYVALLLRFTREPMPEILLAFLPPLASLVRGTVGSHRGRVVLRQDSLEVRRVLTRRYPWSTIRSITLEDGLIEITPEGWVRTLPIPANQSRRALARIDEWRASLPR